MDVLIAKSGRTFTRLPINGEQGFPQSFPLSFNGASYRFKLYINVAAHLLEHRPPFIKVPREESFLVVTVERELADSTREVVFVRKIVPDLEYEAENIALVFSTQQIARENLNGQGDHGTQIVGGITQRWA